jgi:uroporphyrin-3 C-methyltransferase
MSEKTQPPEDKESTDLQSEADTAEDTPSTDIQPDEAPSPDDTFVNADESQPVVVRGGGRGIAVLALLFALSAAGGAAYVWWIQQQTLAGAAASRADFQGDIGRLERSVTGLAEERGDTRRQENQERQRQSDLQDDIDRLSARVSAIGETTQRLATQATPGARPRWQRQEIEQLLRIANHQLRLADDPGSALAALEEADQALRDLDDPTLVPVRQQLASDILALKSINQPDVEGIALRLGSLAARVDTLRLSGMVNSEAEESSAATQNDSGFARIRRRIGEFFADIFRVRKTTGSSAPLLAPDEAFFLRRNVELELRSARLALLSDDEAVYRESLRSARRWVEEYFDTGDQGVGSFISAIAELEGRRLAVSYPDISGSIRMLRQISQLAGQDE